VPPETTFDYANLTGRPSAPLVTALAKVLPGVGFVQAQHHAYAQQWRAANLVALARPGPRWIVLGDSMSQGIGASAFDHGWVNRVNDRLTADGHGYELVNLSASGARVPDLLEQQLPIWRALPASAERSGDDRPDLVTVLIGSNDLLGRRHRDVLPAAFAQLLDELPASAVVTTLPQPRTAARAVNALIEAAHAQDRIRVVDLRRSGPPSWRGRLAEDHFHPNDAGYQALADAFYPVIASAHSK
jgi:lysophospholipase L1-like esterase